MRIMDLKNRIQQGEFFNLVLFTGDETYLVASYTKLMIQKNLDPSMLSINHLIMEDESDMNKIVQACESMPMFSQKKCVEVRNSGLFKKKKDELGTILDYVENPNESVCLLFREEKIDKRNALYRLILKNGIAFDFAYRNEHELIRWIQSLCKKQQKTIDQAAAMRLVENCDIGMVQIENELQKVLLYTKDRCHISLQDVDEVCVPSVKAGIFAFTESLADGHINRAFELMNELLARREPHYLLFYMISRQFTQLYETLCLHKAKKTQKEMGSLMKIPPFVVKRNLSYAQKYGDNNIKQAIHILHEMDTHIKNGEIRVETALDLLVHRLTKKAYHMFVP